MRDEEWIECSAVLSTWRHVVDLIEAGTPLDGLLVIARGIIQGNEARIKRDLPVVREDSSMGWDSYR